MSLNGILLYVSRAAQFALIVGGIYLLVRGIRLWYRKISIDWKRELVRLLFVVYIAALTEIIALRGGAGNTRSVQWAPMKTTLSQLRGGVWAFVYHTVGNMIWFVPLGMFLHRRGWKCAILWGMGASLALECIQLALGTGVTDVDDVLLNALGAWLGAVGMKWACANGKRR